MKKVHLILLGLVAAVALVLGVRSLLDQRRTAEEIRTLQGRVYDARVAVDSCRNELAYQETLFQRFDSVVGSLRSEVDAFEALDERGVPEEEYDAYMRAFDGYNDSVDAWEDRADSLRATESVCRMLVERHNALTDSFRVRLTEEGLMEGRVDEPGRTGPDPPDGGR